jgi:hypothetical protein
LFAQICHVVQHAHQKASTLSNIVLILAS